MSVGPAIREEVYRVNWLPVASTNVESVGYVEDFARLWVRFAARSGKGGYTPPSVYVYYGVPYPVFAGLLAAPSKGTYLDANVKKAGYGYDRVL